jgi:hypothetical protein
MCRSSRSVPALRLARLEGALPSFTSPRRSRRNSACRRDRRGMPGRRDARHRYGVLEADGIASPPRPEERRSRISKDVPEGGAVRGNWIALRHGGSAARSGRGSRGAKRVQPNAQRSGAPSQNRHCEDAERSEGDEAIQSPEGAPYILWIASPRARPRGRNDAEAGRWAA